MVTYIHIYDVINIIYKTQKVRKFLG